MPTNRNTALPLTELSNRISGSHLLIVYLMEFLFNFILNCLMNSLDIHVCMNVSNLFFIRIIDVVI